MMGETLSAIEVVIARERTIVWLVIEYRSDIASKRSTLSGKTSIETWI